MLKISQVSKKISMFIMICLLFSLCIPAVYADDLNGVGSVQSNTSTTVVENEVVKEPVVTTKDNTTSTQSNPSATQSNTTQSNTTQSNTTQSTTTSTQSKVEGLPESTQNSKDVEDTANAIGGMFTNVGPDAEDIEAANTFIAPFANILNKIMAVILGLTSLLMMFVTVLDLLYMAFPPIRDSLDGGRLGAANMAGGRGMGGRGMGSRGMGMSRGMGGGYGMQGGYGMNSGMGMGMQGGMQGGQQGGQQQQVGGGLSAVGRWVSDEAIAACMESQGGVMQGQAGMGGVPVKSMIFSYMKKRAMFLILFGVCVILFTSTVFTDLGIRLGTWILKIILGFGA